jgi:tRNA G18 (ribose-2'-O)-methylase SpoU
MWVFPPFYARPVPTRIDLTSIDDPRFAPFAPDYRGVKEKQLAAEFAPAAPGQATGSPDAPHGKLYAEGRTVIEQLVISPHTTLSVVASPSIAESHADLLARLPAQTPLFILPKDAMDAIVGFSLHRGLLAVAARRPVPPVIDFLTDAAATGRTLVVLEDLSNHDNIGAAFRLAAAFRCAGVLLSPSCADPLYRKSLRVSSGHALRVPWTWATNWPHDLRRAGDHWHTIAMTPSAPLTLAAARSLDASPTTRPAALVIGAEGPGLTDAAMNACHHRARIDMAPDVDSLNAAICLAIGLYEVHRGVSGG